MAHLAEQQRQPHSLSLLEPSPCLLECSEPEISDILPCLHEPGVQPSAIHNMRKVEQPWNQSTALIRSPQSPLVDFEASLQYLSE